MLSLRRRRLPATSARTTPRSARKCTSSGLRGCVGGIEPDAGDVRQPRLCRIQDLLLQPRPEAMHRLHAPRLRGGVQLFEGLHAELLVQGAHALGAEAGQAQHRAEVGGHLGTQPLQQRTTAGGDDLADLAGQVRADARQRVEVRGVARPSP